MRLFQIIVPALIGHMILTIATSTAFAQAPSATTFTYQGDLKSAGGPATGLHDFKFRLFDAAESGGQVGSEVTASSVKVQSGLFSVPLDFGAAFSGDQRWLEIDVKKSGDGAYTLLQPRLRITAAPLATYALDSASADTATAAGNGVPEGFSVLGTSETPPAGFTWTGKTVGESVEHWARKAEMSASHHTLHGAAVNGKFYVVADGFTAVYDPVANSWDEKLEPMPTFRGGAHAVAAIRGKVYAVGGSVINGNPLVNEMYDPDTDSWTAKQSLPLGIDSGAMCACNGRLYAISDNNLEEYDPAANQWTVRESAPHDATVGFGAAAVDGKIYVFGGSDNAHLVYDPAQDDGAGGDTAWAELSAMPTGRQYPCTVAINNKIYCLGGHNGTTQAKLNEIYVPEFDMWEVGRPMQVARGTFAAAAINNRIYVAGGLNKDISDLLLQLTEEYSPAVPLYYVHAKQ